MATIPIAFAFDKNMEMPAGVCISSLLSNANEETFYDIFILHHQDDDFSDSRIAKLCSLYPNCRITFRAVGDSFDNSFEIRGITKATYYKLLIPNLITEYDKILYSDVDVIFREDLSYFYERDLDDCFFAGVNSVPVMNEDQRQYIKTIGFNQNDSYYYAGNIVINSKLIREKKLIPKFLSHLVNKYRFQDMDIMNITSAGRIKPLPPAFCLTINYYYGIINLRNQLKAYYTEEELDHALRYGIVHYNGAKPWKDMCLNMDIWWDYYRKSIFYDEIFAFDFWFNQTYRIEKMTLWKRIKQVARYFRKGGRIS